LEPRHHDPILPELEDADVYQELLDEASFLWRTWQREREASDYTLEELIAGPEARLRAQLDGLALGGPLLAEQLLQPALDHDDPDRRAAAALALLETGDEQHCDIVMAQLADPERIPALAQALTLGANQAAVTKVAALWSREEPLLRSLVLDVLASRNLPLATQRIAEALVSRDRALFAAALHALRLLANLQPAHARYAERAFNAEEPGLRLEALLTGAQLGSPLVWDACRQAALAPDGDRTAFGILALSARPEDRTFLYESLHVPDRCGQALWALGFVGDLEAADAVAGLLADRQHGKLAGEAFSVITGLAIEGPYRRAAAQPDDDDDDDDDDRPGEVGLDQPPPELGPADNLARPDAVAIADWWKNRRPQLEGRQRHVLGQPRTPHGLAAALPRLPAWRLPVLSVELAMATGQPACFNRNDWARVQRDAMAAACAALEPPEPAKRISVKEQSRRRA
jgi:uncharacterized protein (TIGR02270 family)